MAKAKKNKLTVDFSGFAEYMEQLDRLGADVKGITAEALKKSFEAVTPGIQAAISPHEKSGDTEKSLVTSSDVKWEGTRASVEVGFDIPHGGLPSVFLMYGTPKHMGSNQYGSTGKPIPGTNQDLNLYESIYGNKTKNKVRKIQKEIFDEAIGRAMR